MKDAKVFLQSIFEAIEKIESYTLSGKDEFMKSTLIQDAKEQNSEIPWKQMAGLRDVLIHDYMGIS